MYRVGQWHLDVVAGREGQHEFAGGDALGDVPTARQLRRFQRIPGAEPRTERAIT